MKKLMIICSILLVAAFITNCEKETTNPSEILKVENQRKMTFDEKVDFYGINLNSKSSIKGLSYRLDDSGAPIYTELCEGTNVGISPVGLINDPANWEFYKFFGVAGDEISIEGRNYSEVDFAMSLYFGLTDNIEGLTYNTDVGNMEHLIFADDEFSIPDHYIWDPYIINYVLPYTGYYTLGYYTYGWDFQYAAYEIITTGIVCDVSDDSDGDGCLDDDDDVINSNMEETIEIDGCENGVENSMIPGDTCGTMMSDMIDDLEGGTYKNHGAFVKEVSKLINTWYKSGLITRAEKDLIMQCAGNSSIGY